MSDLFLTAARKKLRFASPKGLLTVEDLFDLPLTSNTGKANLDDVARGLHLQLKESTQISFVSDSPQVDDEAQVGLEIVKQVIAIRKAEKDELSRQAEKAATRQKIMALIDQKKDAALGEKSIEDLTALLASL